MGWEGELTLHLEVVRLGDVEEVVALADGQLDLCSVLFDKGHVEPT